LRAEPSPAWPSVVVVAILSIAAARLAADFIVPVLVGIFGAYALRPIVTALTKLRLPEPLAATVVMVALLVVAGSTAYSMRDDVTDALADLPQGVHKLRVRIRDLSIDAKPTPMQHVTAAAEELKKAANEVSGAAPNSGPAAPAPKEPDMVDRFTQQGVNILSTLATLGIALTITLFLLAAGDTFRRKLVRIVGTRLAERRVTVEILDEIDAQIQRFLLVTLVSNAALGLTLWGAFAAIGLERPALWAFSAAVLHVIPYVGILLALVLVGGVAVLQFGTLSGMLAILGATIIAAIVFGIFLQNWLQGRSARMNAVAVFISVLFFGWLWGGWGLLLGAPLIAIVKTVAERIEPLKPVAEFLDG
jgi:predicted PurR-regulated permease PerM